MRRISTEDFQKPRAISAGATPILRWLPIADLVVDPAYHRRIGGHARRKVNRIARSFSWSCFAPVVVAPVAGAKFAIIDGELRASAAALIGLETVPCQIVTADKMEQSAARRAISGSALPPSRMALQAAALVAGEADAVQLVEICARAEVELLRYPVSIERQAAGQTMAIGAISRCLKCFGEETLITALQCVTQTANNRPGVLSARMIKALCEVLHADQARRDSGLALLDAFDRIDLIALQRAASVDAATKQISMGEAICDQIRSELNRRLPNKADKKPPQTTARTSTGDHLFDFRTKMGAKRIRPRPSE
jgi:ParB-like nuclease domain